MMRVKRTFNFSYCIHNFLNYTFKKFHRDISYVTIMILIYWIIYTIFLINVFIESFLFINLCNNLCDWRWFLY